MGRGRPFKKGQPRPPNAGRKKGTQNRVTLEIREFARSVLEQFEYQEAVREMFRTMPPLDIPGHYVTLLSQYAYGKPKEHVEHGGIIAISLVEEAASELQDRLARLAARAGAGEDPGGPQ